MASKLEIKPVFSDPIGLEAQTKEPSVRALFWSDVFEVYYEAMNLRRGDVNCKL